jgi:hypothetical protein
MTSLDAWPSTAPASLHATRLPPRTRVGLSAVEGSRLPATELETSPALPCHPEPAGEGSRRPSSLEPNRSTSAATHRCHLERSREISALPTAGQRCPHRASRGPRNHAAGTRDPSFVGMTAKGGRHLGPSRPATPRSLVPRDDTGRWAVTSDFGGSGRDPATSLRPTVERECGFKRGSRGIGGKLRATSLRRSATGKCRANQRGRRTTYRRCIAEHRSCDCTWSQTAVTCRDTRAGGYASRRLNRV